MVKREIADEGPPLSPFGQAHDVEEKFSPPNEQADESSSKLRVSCSICQKRLANKTTLQKHLRIHTGEKPYQCLQCQRCFRQKEHRDKHAKIHTLGKGHECILCAMTFGRRHFLAKHMLVVHKTDIRENPSPTGYVRGSPVVLKTLPSVPSPKKPKTEIVYSCSTCKKGFTQRYNLKRHMQVQHCESTNTCKLCGKVFKRLSGLTTHQITHTGVRPFQCGICARCFSQKHHLIRHQLVHLPKINIVCSICKQDFRYASAFFQHMAAHDAISGDDVRPPAHEDDNKLYYGTPGATLQCSQLSQPQFVVLEMSDLECMFCGRAMASPDVLHDHLIDHCEMLMAESRVSAAEASSEILGL